VNEQKEKAYLRGLVTFVILMILTAVEYVIAVTLASSTTLLFIVALVKAALIVQIFMHVSRLWRGESH
jgi:heme/copper-type cytochrome/quinol oxidase subunit 4